MYSLVRETTEPDLSPKDKLLQRGCESMRDNELLSLFLDVPLERVTMLLKNRTVNELLHSQYNELKPVLGRAKAYRLVAAFELSRRVLDKGLGTAPVIANPAGTLPFLNEIRQAQKEHFVCLYLNARNQVLQNEIVSIGSLSASIVHPREVFRIGIEHCAASVILAHNHPSGDTSPSRDDIELTQRLVKAGQVMGIEILDHIIVGRNDFLSMKERGLME